MAGVTMLTGAVTPIEPVVYPFSVADVYWVESVAVPLDRSTLCIQYEPGRLLLVKDAIGIALIFAAAPVLLALKVNASWPR